MQQIQTGALVALPIGPHDPGALKMLMISMVDKIALLCFVSLDFSKELDQCYHKCVHISKENPCYQQQKTISHVKNILECCWTLAEEMPDHETKINSVAGAIHHELDMADLLSQKAWLTKHQLII